MTLVSLWMFWASIALPFEVAAPVVVDSEPACQVVKALALARMAPEAEAGLHCTPMVVHYPPGLL